MKTQLSVLLLLGLPLSQSSAQVQYTGEEYRDYYDWFHQYSQTPDFYLDGTTLITFQDNVPLRTAPSVDSKTQVNLPIGKAVTNIYVPVEDAVFSMQNGYLDQWFHVETCSANRNVVEGYVWGGHLAKSWNYFQAPGDKEPSLLALGLSDENRQQPEDIKASLKIIRNGEQAQALTLKGICLFEQCAASSLLRVFDLSEKAPQWIFEASIFSTGCLTGVDKALISWDGNEMHLVHQAEYTTGHTYTSNPFYIRNSEQTQICYYQNENEAYEPVWACRTLDTVVAP
mgnify:CR=1 FL=1